MVVKLRNRVILDNSDNNTYSSFFLVCLGLLQVIKYFALIPVSSANILIVLLGTISMIVVITRKGFSISNQRILGYILLYTIFGVLCYLYNSNMDAIELLWPAGYMFLGVYFLNFGIPLKTSRFVFYSVAIAFLAEIVANGNVNMLIASFSRNIISVYLLLFFALFIISSYENEARVSLLAPITFLVVCFAAVGRGGVVLGILTIILFTIFDFSKKIPRMRNPILIPIVIFAFAILFIAVNHFVPDLISNVLYNFESRGASSQRYPIWSDYVSKTFSSLLNIIFGSSMSGTVFLNRYSENLHNSFLMLHAKYGIIAFLFIIGKMIKVFHKTIVRRNYTFLVLLILMLFRMNLDYTNFNDCLDLPLVILLFYDSYNIDKYETNQNDLKDNV